ncbi:mechanosensitive ion channel protein MscS [Salinigranum rubrum]|uniref:Mechanosensitive ion channel protein MscS n=1 Tax=Salinigranum rubrum TaxID=755307 RepID=A0A2I8VNW2_9EURY|nr:mechanosensitive ion channel domain-containing protein [Salinigranum rubrum]AUV83617.1 mechanosensitive ion channel protein MscS [Salinigranum rubrum]
MQSSVGFLAELVEETVIGIQQSLIDAVPNLIMALVFVTVAYVGIKIVLRVVRGTLDAIYPDEQDLIVNLATTVVGVFLWFTVALTLLNILGMGDIAASLGTAAGFIALGVSYALSSMIADTVAGVYLLRDPDFNPGDRVTADETTGKVTDIGLRKSRFELDGGETVVVANSAVEKKWTLEDESLATATADESSG